MDMGGGAGMDIRRLSGGRWPPVLQPGPRGRKVSDPQAAEEVAITAVRFAERFERVRGEQEAVLLDDQPAVVIVAPKRVDDRRDPGVSTPELDERALDERCFHALALSGDRVQYRCPAILRMDVADQLVVRVHQLDGIRAAEARVAGVHAEAQ